MRHRLIILVFLLCVVGAGIWSVSTNRRAVKADSISTLLSGSAYGFYAVAINGATNLSSGPIGEVSTDCNPRPLNQQNTTLGLNLFHGLLTSTTIQDRLTFTHTDYTSTVVSTSTIEKLTIGNSVLGPLLEIDGLHAEAHSTARIGQASSDTSHSFFGTLRVGGARLPLAVRPNQRIFVPGLGTVTLNEQVTQNNGPVRTYAEVNMVDIALGAGNILKQPVGTRIIIGHALSMNGTVSILAALHSHAFGLEAELTNKGQSTIQVGPVPDAAIGCLGGTNSASVLTLHTPLIANGGIAQVQASGSIRPSLVTASSSEKITDLNLLGGLITAKTLQASAYAAYKDRRGSHAGTFKTSELRIGGINIVSESIHVNTRINLPGLGYVMLDEQVPSPYTIGYSFNALDIYITTPNKLKLAPNLHIVGGHVDAGLTIF